MLERAFALMPAITATRDWTIRQVTPSACAILQTGSSQLVGRQVGEVLGLDVRSLEAQGTDAFDILCNAPLGEMGEILPLRLRGVLLAEEPEGVYAAFCLIDLSRERKADAQIRALNVQLHHICRLNSLGERAAILAHELTQPLTAASSYLHGVETDLGKIGLMGQSAARTAGLAKGEILRAGEITRRLRDLLNGEALSLATERISLIMDDLALVLKILARDAGATLEILVERDGDEALVDRTQLQQVITNLVRNGIEAAILNSSPRVRISGKVMENGAYRITVEDSGPGIPGNDLAALLDPLSSSKPGVAGLGLSITRKILERHGGELRSGSGDLGGAALWFELRSICEEHRG